MIKHLTICGKTSVKNNQSYDESENELNDVNVIENDDFEWSYMTPSESVLNKRYSIVVQFKSSVISC